MRRGRTYSVKKHEDEKSMTQIGLDLTVSGEGLLAD